MKRASEQSTSRPLPTFPDSVVEPCRQRRRRLLRGAAATVVVGVVAGIGAYAAQQVAADEAGGARVATATRRSVDETVEAVAAIEPVTRAELAFPVDGEVATVAVEVGDAVAIGDVLATVLTDELEQAITEAEAALADAELTLNVALSGENPSSGVGQPSMSGAGLAGGVTFQLASVTSASSIISVVSTDEVTAARQAVASAQSSVTAALNDVAARRDAAANVCAAVAITIDPVDPSASLIGITDSLGACQTALGDLLAAQDALTAALTARSDAAAALDALLSTWATELEGASTGTTEPDVTVPGGNQPDTTEPGATVPDGNQPDTAEPGATVPDGNQPDTAEPGGSIPGPGRASGDGADAATGGGHGGTAAIGGGGVVGGNATPVEESSEPTSEELIAYQSAYDAALSRLEAARQSLAQAKLVSPVDGVVVATGFAVGDEVSAGSEAIIVQGAGGYEATFSVSVDDVDQIEVGQSATLAPDGSDASIDGQVVAVSAVPDSSSTSASYRVTVGLDGTAVDDGNIGDVSVVVGHSDDVVAVPTSAVTPGDGGYTVTVIDDLGERDVVAVEIGSIGTEYTEIVSGVDIGDVVVLATLDTPLPSTATDTSSDDDFTNERRSGFGTTPPTGAFPGGGGPPRA